MNDQRWWKINRIENVVRLNRENRLQLFYKLKNIILFDIMIKLSKYLYIKRFKGEKIQKE